MKDVLQLAVDARDIASDTRGIGRYTRAILRRLAGRGDIELTLLVKAIFPSRQRDSLCSTLGTDRFNVSNRAKNVDAIWHPANGSFFRADTPSVVTIHDAVPFRFPDPDPKRRAHQQEPFLRSIRDARRIVAVSDFDRVELVAVFGLPHERIEVIHHGVDPSFAPDRASTDRRIDEPYLLFVGDPIGEPRKNFTVLYEAYRRAFSGSNDPRLAVVGERNPKLDGVIYAGVAGDDARGGGDAKLATLYRDALALCVPSYYETFGMPVVEAMACGTPVIASRASCLPEIAGDAAYYAPPQDVDAWSAALRDVAENADVRNRLREAGLVRSRLYDWDQSARRHAEVFLHL